MNTLNQGHAITRRYTEPSINTYLFGVGNATKDEQLAYIDKEIMRAEDGIVKLVLQRAFLKRRRNSFSPAVNLPTEVLALIFEFACLPNYNESDDDCSDNIDRRPGCDNLGLSIGMGAVTPIFLGSICSKWRQVSQGASQLWSNVTMHINNQHAEEQSLLLQSWLAHSALRPLSIKVVEDESGEQDNDEDWGIDVTSSSIIEVLTAYSHQWQTIDFFLPSSWTHILSRIKNKLPILTNATLRVADSSPSMSRVSAFSLAPQLREVRLVGYSTANVVLPWSQIQGLHEEYFGVQECLDALRLCPNVRSCEFEQIYHGSLPFLSLPIRHDVLESFELIIDESRELNALFGAMTLPNLKEFILSISDDGSLLQSVIPLIQRSGCKLQKVHLVGDMPHEDDLINFLKEMPMLKVLMLINPTTESGGKVTQRLLDLLNPHKAAFSSQSCNPEVELPGDFPPETCLVPMLEELEYQGATGFSSHGFAEFLVSRWRVESQEAGKVLPISQLPEPPANINDSAKPSAIAPGISPVKRNEDYADADDHHSSAGSRPGTPVLHRRAQLRSVVITTTKKIKFESEDAKVVIDLLQEGMHLDFLDDPNAD